jgi:L-amino acid N-acyltransferase YncA
MIRPARIEDLPQIVDIHNQAIDAGFQTCFTTKSRPEERVAWFNEHTPDKYPMLVYEKDNAIVGYLTVSDYRQGRGALRFAAEVSYFIHNDYQQQGIGTQLLDHGLQLCAELGYKTLLAIILEPNVGSTRLLEKFGFEKWAYLPTIADFNGVECSQVYYGKKITGNL